MYYWRPELRLSGSLSPLHHLLAMWPWDKEIKPRFSNGGNVAPLGTFGNVWRHSGLSWWGCYWHLMHRGQGYCWTSYNTQDRIIWLKMLIVQGRGTLDPKNLLTLLSFSSDLFRQIAQPTETWNFELWNPQIDKQGSPEFSLHTQHCFKFCEKHKSLRHGLVLVLSENEKLE